MQRPRAVQCKQHGRRPGKIQSRGRRVPQFYKFGRVCCFVEGGGGQFLSSASVESCNVEVLHVVAGECGAMAIIIVLGRRSGTDVRMTKGRAKGCDQNRKQRKQRRNSPHRHISCQLLNATPSDAQSQIVRAKRLRARSRSGMRLTFRKHDFSADRAIGIDEICSGEQNAQGPPHEANF